MWLKRSNAKIRRFIESWNYLMNSVHMYFLKVKSCGFFMRNYHLLPVNSVSFYGKWHHTRKVFHQKCQYSIIGLSIQNKRARWSTPTNQMYQCQKNLLSASAKGQLILKKLFGVFKSTKKTNKIFFRISALASKKWSYQKNIGTPLW